MGVATGTAAAPSEGRQQCAGRGDMGLSAMMEAVKVFDPAATKPEFSKKTTEMEGGCRG